MTTTNDIRVWLIEKKEEGYTHVAIVCDTFDYDDYPVGIKAETEEEVRNEVERVSSGSMSQLMEVYALHRDLESQLRERRAFHYDVAVSV